jgi:anti-sigma regulatory factor (Ser/Thr protein kinase)
MRIARRAGVETPASLRRALSAFLEVLGVTPEQRMDIVGAVGEALANAVEHAYLEDLTGDVALCARLADDDCLHVEVSDRGRFIQRERQSGRGFGISIIRGLARSVEFDTQNGTTVRMIFQVEGTACARPIY